METVVSGFDLSQQRRTFMKRIIEGYDHLQEMIFSILWVIGVTAFLLAAVTSIISLVGIIGFRLTVALLSLYACLYIAVASAPAYVISVCTNIQFYDALVFFVGVCLVRHVIQIARVMWALAEDVYRHYDWKVDWVEILSNFCVLLLLPDTANPRKFQFPL